MSFSLFRGLFLSVLISGAVLISQAESNRTAVNSVYIEGLGPGLAYSLNYERLVINDLGVRVGLSYMSFSASADAGSGNTSSAKASFMTFPITASYLGVSSGKHTLEMGGGPTIIYASGSSKGVGINVSGSGVAILGNVLLGYRIHPVNGGFQFRVGFSGLFGKGLGLSSVDPTAFGFLPWFYISLGGCFK
jgi:hypothetical protein